MTKCTPCLSTAAIYVGFNTQFKIGSESRTLVAVPEQNVVSPYNAEAKGNVRNVLTTRRLLASFEHPYKLD